MITAYLIGVALSAALFGYTTPHREVNADSRQALFYASLGWPIILVAALGHACRLFSVKRTIEDQVSA